MSISLRRTNRLLVLVAVMALCLTAVSGTAQAGSGSGTALWPRFSMPDTVFVADATGVSNDDLLTLTTLQGIYNGAEKQPRLYVKYEPEDGLWQTRMPDGVHVETIPPPSGESLVQQLIERFHSVIRGAVVTNPSNVDTVNLATTMAGLDETIAISPGQESMVKSLGIPVLYDFNTEEFTNDDPVQTYQWGVDHLLPQTSTRVLTMLPGTDGGDRDYAVATRQFVFRLTSTDPAQKALMATIVAHTPANTPVMGWLVNENADVGYLSSLGHFVNASQGFSNGTVWASMPSPASVHQPTEPAAIAAQPNTVYIAFLQSDGDNAYFMQQRMAQLWQQPGLDSVPEGWTVAPGTVDYAPTLLQYYADHLPDNSELVSGPSGIGYATQLSGPDLTRFAQLSSEIMKRDDLKTVDNFQSLGTLDQYAQDSAVPSISSFYPMLEKQVGNTVAIGQSSGYVKTAQSLFCAVDQQRRTIQPGKPLFLEPYVDAWTLTPNDLLHIAQQLALAAQASGLHYVFTTPTELALTMQRYYAGQEAGLPTSNAQSMTGQQALAEPIVDPPYPSNPVQVTGTNIVTNPSGASGTAGWTTSGGDVSATTYQGQPALRWDSDVTTGQSWAHYYPAVQNGQTYTFSADVAGSGEVFMDVYDGTADWATLPVKLGSQYQTVTWTVTIPSTAPGGQTGNAPQLQIRSSGGAPVSVDIANASVATSTAAC